MGGAPLQRCIYSPSLAALAAEVKRLDSFWVAHAFQGVHSSAEDEQALAAEANGPVRLCHQGGTHNDLPNSQEEQ